MQEKTPMSPEGLERALADAKAIADALPYQEAGIPPDPIGQLMAWMWRVYHWQLQVTKDIHDLKGDWSNPDDPPPPPWRPKNSG